MSICPFICPFIILIFKRLGCKPLQNDDFFAFLSALSIGDPLLVGYYFVFLVTCLCSNVNTNSMDLFTSMFTIKTTLYVNYD